MTFKTPLKLTMCTPAFIETIVLILLNTQSRSKKASFWSTPNPWQKLNTKSNKVVFLLYTFSKIDIQMIFDTTYSYFRLVKSDTEIVKFDTENMSSGSPLIISRNDTAKIVTCKVTRLPSQNWLLEDLVIFH